MNHVIATKHLARIQHHLRPLFGNRAFVRPASNSNFNLILYRQNKVLFF